MSERHRAAPIERPFPLSGTERRRAWVNPAAETAGTTHPTVLRRRANPRSGMVLILVLVVVAALSLGALAFSELMINRREIVHLTERQVQAAALAESGLEVAKLLLTEQPDVRYADGSWQDNAEWFRGVVVVDDGTERGRGRFSIVAPALPTELQGEMRFGLECESAKLNLNTLATGGSDAAEARQCLMGLPEMTEEIADAILDWLDEDDETREFGAESQYYQALAAPYQPANGPLRRLEELLHVRGVTREHLFGADANQSGWIDPEEATAFATTAERGWSAYLTLHSRELDRRADGQPKINLNQDDLESLHAELEEALGAEWATFIVGYRQQEELYGEGDDAESSRDSTGSSRDNAASETPPANPLDDAGNEGPGSESQGGERREEEEMEEDEVEYEDQVTGELDLSKPAAQTLDSVLDLIGQSIKVEYEGRDKPVVVAPLFPDDRDAMRDYLPKLLECVTTDETDTPAGRVNVNLAPAAVLAGVPGIDADLAAQIVARRPADTAGAASEQQNPTWLLIEGLVTLDEMKEMLPRLTTGGSVYWAQVIGYFDEGGPAVRLEAILDATTLPVRVISLRDMTSLGRGFEPGVLDIAGFAGGAVD
ncbi:MAG: type II secretion system protein GspK [Thermoguttaceae bacterium]|jgi:type II secretory pathway component PulK|nr:type II secretion system protein GspK [Thermoguttaceae bacterium]